LATALANVVAHLLEIYGTNQDAMNLARRDWSTQQLFGMDKDSVSVRLSKAYLSMLGDGSTHIYKVDAIRRRRWTSAVAALVQDEAFDVVVTNPPFGTKLRVTGEVGREEGYALSKRWRKRNGAWEETGDYETRDLGLIFLERCIRLLNNGGRLAIVLPDTYLFSPSYGWLMKWLSHFTITHSINVPIEAFEPHCRAKTSVIVLRKPSPSGDHRIIGSVCSTFGEDKHGRPRYKFIDGKQSGERDDEMAEAAGLMKAPPKEPSKLYFEFSQNDAIQRGVLVASYWWRKPYIEALERFAKVHQCELVSVGELISAGELEVTEGHGSPNSHFHGHGSTPYVKVVDIKNWRVIENPKYAIPEDIAAKYRKARPLKPFDLVTPTRASKNIGLFGVIMPWQTKVVLTREIEIWRVTKGAKRIDPWVLLALVSLGAVHDQFNFLVVMQVNREDLGERYKELLLPLPTSAEKREEWAWPIRDFFEATIRARESYDNLGKQLDPTLFADRP
jgi:type I restriction enzyme M protein